MLRFHQYERANKYFKFALSQNQNDIEILYGYSLSLFRSYVSFKDQIQIGRVNTQGTANSNQGPPIKQNTDLSQQSQSEQLQLKQVELYAAVKYLKKVRQMDPTYVAAIKLIGEIYMKEKRFDRAVEYLKEALSLNERDSEVLVMLGNILHEHE